VKFAVVICVFAAVQALAQSTPHSGVRIGGSVAYLTASSDIHEPASYVDPDAHRRAQLLLTKREQEQAQAKCSGAVPLTIDAEGSATEMISRETPCVAFETWAEERSSDYAESVQTGFTSV
jgi:hypothetical protein